MCQDKRGVEISEKPAIVEGAMADELIENQRLYRTSSKRISTPLIITIVLLLAVLLGGAYVFFQAQKKTNTVESPLPSPAPTTEKAVTPSPTEEVTPTGSVSTTPAKVTPGKATPTTKPAAGTVDRSEVSISVLNGSGTAGAASKTSNYLKGLGYTISGTGNADTFDYEDITIAVKKGNTALLNQLKKDLASEGTVGSATTDYTGTADAQVIIGK